MKNVLVIKSSILADNSTSNKLVDYLKSKISVLISNIILNIDNNMIMVSIS